ncbi:hypothetical protein D3C81_725850 [compost metagenome]
MAWVSNVNSPSSTIAVRIWLMKNGLPAVLSCTSCATSKAASGCTWYRSPISSVTALTVSGRRFKVVLRTAAAGVKALLLGCASLRRAKISKRLPGGLANSSVSKCCVPSSAHCMSSRNSASGWPGRLNTWRNSTMARSSFCSANRVGFSGSSGSGPMIRLRSGASLPSSRPRPFSRRRISRRSVSRSWLFFASNCVASDCRISIQGA